MATQALGDLGRAPRAHRRDRLQSVERSLAILGEFSSAEPALGITALSRRLQLSKSIVYRSIRTLVSCGFLEHDAEHPSLYRIGLRAFEVGSLYLLHNDLYESAIGPMRDLAAASGHNVYLGVLHGAHVVYVAALDGGSPVQVRVTVGSRAFAHATAMGKVLLAHLPAAELEAVLADRQLERVTPRTITSVAALRRSLAEIRSAGHATNRGESFIGVGSVAGPIRDKTGAVVAAVSTGFPLDLVTEDEIAAMVGPIVTCATSISRRLGAVVAA